MKKSLTTLGIGHFRGGDLRLAGNSSTFQGQVSVITKIDADTLNVMLCPFAEKSADGQRWTLSPKPNWDLTLCVEEITSDSPDEAVLKTSEGETVVLFAKNHAEGLDYQELKGHDLGVRRRA